MESSRIKGAFESDNSIRETSERNPNAFSKIKINGNANNVITEFPRNHFKFIHSILLKLASCRIDTPTKDIVYERKIINTEMKNWTLLLILRIVKIETIPAIV